MQNLYTPEARLREDLAEREDLLLQAKAVVLCGLPYKPTDEKQVTRVARIGRESVLKVTYAAVGQNAKLPYGTDRSLLAWIQTKAWPTGEARWSTVKGFLDAFQLSASGEYYDRFYEAIGRLKRMHIQIETQAVDQATGVEGEIIVNTAPIEASFTPRSEKHVKNLIDEEMAGQLSLMEETNFGFVLHKGFMRYFRENFQRMPLGLMIDLHPAPKQWDVAQWMFARCRAAKHPSLVPFDDLLLQFGASKPQIEASANYRGNQKQRIFKPALAAIKKHYPDFPACFEYGYKGLHVEPWTPS